MAQIAISYAVLGPSADVQDRATIARVKETLLESNMPYHQTRPNCCASLGLVRGAYCSRFKTPYQCQISPTDLCTNGAARQ